MHCTLLKPKFNHSSRFRQFLTAAGCRDSMESTPGLSASVINKTFSTKKVEIGQAPYSDLGLHISHKQKSYMG